MTHRLAMLTAAALASALPGAAGATTAIDYNILVRGNFTASSSDVEGRMAAGGNISVGSYAIGAKASSGGYVAVAGGTFNATSGGSANGNVLANAYAGYAAPGQTQYSVSGSKDTYANASSPIAIASELSRLATLSTSLSTNASSYGTLGSISLQNANVTFTGTGSGINMFTVADSVLASASSFNFALPTGAIAIINVDGAASSLANTGYSGIASANLLWNFYNATSLSLTSANGSILATGADISTSSGAINGQIFANSWTGNAQINAVNFAMPSLLGASPAQSAKATTAVPEPSNWAMMMLGFGTMGFCLRRQRNAKVRIGGMAIKR